MSRQWVTEAQIQMNEEWMSLHPIVGQRGWKNAVKQLSFSSHLCDSVFRAVAHVETGRLKHKYGSHTFLGYSNFRQVEAETFISATQLENTILADTRERIELLFSLVPSLQRLVDEARQRLPLDSQKLDLLRLHILSQGEGCMTNFTPHRDTDDDEDSTTHKRISCTLYTIVVLLTNTQTSMRVVLTKHTVQKDSVQYRGQGSGVLFLSALFHETVFAEAGTVKVTFFFGRLCSSSLNKTY
jgi:hypothetical protein